MEQATKRSETAVVDKLILSWTENIDVPLVF